mmetsp:Transcript_10832/g.9366  ORF Transcript_10832/g.9366 Transcript_10832/m.9366 type:complete len:80 (-) Transcript_10832:290-529(-)
MQAFERNAEYLKNELRSLKNRYIELKGDQKCEECMRSIFTEEFYLFPCSHCYHKSCLKKKMTSLKIHQDKLREVDHLDK